MVIFLQQCLGFVRKGNARGGMAQHCLALRAEKSLRLSAHTLHSAADAPSDFFLVDFVRVEFAAKSQPATER
jgi:hypothetical protein